MNVVIFGCIAIAVCACVNLSMIIIVIVEIVVQRLDFDVGAL